MRTLNQLVMGVMLVASLSPILQAQTAKPVAPGELIALVAGGALDENIVREIGSRGLNFQPDDQFRSFLVTAGADATVLGALKNARAGATPFASNDTKESLEHLAKAGQ